jgi:hypothetical protein
VEYLVIEEFQDVLDRLKYTDLGTIKHTTGIPTAALDR